MAKRRVSFSTDAGLIARLGRELVGKQETALTELIKNSYDADATDVDVILGKDALEIRDNGSGMTRAELEDGFLRIAGIAKQRAPKSPKYQRVRAGRKGIGRFATERLGRKLVLRTRSAKMRYGFELVANWDAFRPGKNLNDIKIDLKIAKIAEPGTSITIEKLRDDWTDAQFRRCFNNVMGLLQPFPVARVSGSSRRDPGFHVRFSRSGEELEDTTIADLQTEILAHAPAVIEARVNAKGEAEWRILKNRFGIPRAWTSHHHAGVKRSPERYAHLRNVSMKAYYFILSPELFSGIVFSRIRALLSELGGIRVYRNGFRVVPYGDPDDDWLGLDRTYASRSETLAPVANRNFFGVVEINDVAGVAFDERTSREGLIDTFEFQELQDFLSSVLITSANEIAADRGRVGRASERKSKDRDRLSPATNIRKKLSQIISSTSGANRKRLEELDRDIGEVERSEAALVQEVEMLRFLASIGMASSEFSHEIRMSFQSFGLDLDQLIEFVRKSTRAAEESGIATRLEGARGRIEAFTGYFNEAMASRNLRTRTPVSLKRSVLDFAEGVRPLVEQQNISIEVLTSPLDPLFTKPVHEAEVSSILLNFLTNSIKAIKRNGKDRKIQIEARRGEEGLLLLRFSDSGDGIDRSLRERIFDPFVTIQSAPSSRAQDEKRAIGTGLGLWIVRQIVNSLGGEVDIGRTAPGFSTSIDVSIPDEDAADG